MYQAGRENKSLSMLIWVDDIKHAVILPSKCRANNLASVLSLQFNPLYTLIERHSDGNYASQMRGRVNQKVDPSPEALSTPTSP